jgi:phosphoglycolate phosphatase
MQLLPWKIKNLVWDWNGTLLDDVWLCVESINELLTNRKKPPISIAEYKNIFGFPVRDYYERAGFDFKQEKFEHPALEFIDLYTAKSKQCLLNQHGRALLEYFSQLGINQYVLSASETKVLSEILSQHGLKAYLQSYYGLDNHYANGKLGLAKIMAQELMLAPKETVLIGDTLHDYEVSMELGWKSILYSNGHYSRSRLEDCESAIIIDNLQEIKQLIQIQNA